MNIKNLEDLNILGINRMNPRSTFFGYETAEKAETYNRNFSKGFKLLNGNWKCMYSEHPDDFQTGKWKAMTNHGIQTYNILSP